VKSCLPDKKQQNFACLPSCRYWAYRAQNLPEPAPNNVLRVLELSSKSVRFRRSFITERVNTTKLRPKVIPILASRIYYNVIASKRITRCSRRQKTSPLASAASHCSHSHAPLYGINSLKVVPPTCHPSRRQMHSSNASRLADRACYLRATPLFNSNYFLINTNLYL